MPDFVCISPIDGSEYMRRRKADEEEIERVFAAARHSQPAWARTPMAERERICSAAVDAILAMKDEIVPELAWTIGRPMAHGSSELAGFEERARHMIAIAAEALAPFNPGPKPGFKR